MLSRVRADRVMVRQRSSRDARAMFNTIWRFLVFRLAGGRFLVALTVVNWLWRRISRDRTVPPATNPDPPATNRATSR